MLPPSANLSETDEGTMNKRKMGALEGARIAAAEG
jgi:hypothetical protein